jgi:hypothetical protein
MELLRNELEDGLNAIVEIADEELDNDCSTGLTVIFRVGAAESA